MKNFKNILIGLVIIVILVIGAIAIFGKDNVNEDVSKVEDVVEKEKIIMVTEAGFAPYEFYDGEEIVGVDVEKNCRENRKRIRN